MVLDSLLSYRAGTTVASLNRPWRFAEGTTYDPETNPSGLVSFSTAENALVTNELVAYANKHFTLQNHDFLYRGAYSGGPLFKEALAEHVNELFQPYQAITEDEIQVSSSASAMHNALAWSLADSRDAILTSRPVYGRLELDFFNQSGVQVEYADTQAEDCFDEKVVEKLEEAFQSAKSRHIKVKAVFIINPHNPLGRPYPRNTLVAIMEFCQKHRLHLISDEIYACSVFESGEPDTTPFTSVLSIDSEKHIDKSLLHVIYGLSKDFGAAGLRVGALITRSQSVLKAVSSVSRFHSASAPCLSFGAMLLKDKNWRNAFIISNQKKLADAYQHAVAALNDIGVAYLPGSNAGFFLWIDLSPYLSEEERFPEFALAKKLRDANVFLHPQEEHALRPGWFRLVFTQRPEIVTEGINRIKKAIS